MIATCCSVGSAIQEIESSYIENIAYSASAIISYNGGKFYAIQLLIMNNLSFRKGIVLIHTILIVNT